MRWGLLWWKLMVIVLTSLSGAEGQVIKVSDRELGPNEPMEPVEPVDTVEEADQVVERPSTQPTRVAFYDPGTDFFNLPELYRNIKAGKNASEVYIGPTFTKEFMMKTPSEKRASTGFKLLDWKRRRKRLDKEEQNPNDLKTGNKVKKECPETKDIVITGSAPSQEGGRFMPESNTSIDGYVEYNNRGMAKDVSNNIFYSNKVSDNSNLNLKMNVQPIKIFTQPSYKQEKNILVKEPSVTARINRPETFLRFSNDSLKRRFKRRNWRYRKRPKRDEKVPYRYFLESTSLAGVSSKTNFASGSSTAKPWTPTNALKFVSNTNSSSELTTSEKYTFRIVEVVTKEEHPTTEYGRVGFTAYYATESSHSKKVEWNSSTSTKIPYNFHQVHQDATEDSEPDLYATKAHHEVTSPRTETHQESYHEVHDESKETSTEATTAGHDKAVSYHEVHDESKETSTEATTVGHDKSVSPSEHDNLSKKEIQKDTTSNDTENTLSSKSKAKIFIGGEEMPLHNFTHDKQLNLLAINHENLLLLTNPVPVFAACVTPPPSTTCDLSQDEKTQRADCHPKGTGPLSPASFDNEVYGQKNEEEVEDALTGRLADRVVDVVMAKVGKAPRMMKELGLYAQGNLSNIQCSVSHPEGKEACKEKSSDSLKQTVLEEIAASVEKLANSKSNGACLKPPDDLSEFLGWILSDDSDMEMPEPNLHLSLTPKREADYLFRPNGVDDEAFNELKDVDHKYKWDNWMNFAEEPSDDGTDHKGQDVVEGHESGQDCRRRTPRHLMHKRRPVARRPSEHGRRRRYTPWSLSDYP